MAEAQKRAGAKTALLLGATALALLAASFAIRLWWFNSGDAIPALLQDLPLSNDEGSQKIFIARLERKFPVGSSESALVAELRAEGFTLRADTPASQRAADFDRRGSLIRDPCRRGGNVRWSAENDRLTEITGGHYIHCP